MKRFAKFLIFLFFIAFILFGTAFFITYFYIKFTLPKIFTIEEYKKNCLKTTKIYSADGKLIDEIYKQRRTLFSPEEVPKHLINAVISAEDKNFYSHPGIDILGILRAMVKDIIAMKYKYGGSTITQQVAKTFFLTPEKTIIRKWKEIILAKELELHFTKNEILYLYLNQIYFGHGRYGVVEAANYYFGKAINQLSLEESALLAGMIKSPLRYSPKKNPEKALKRRNQILQLMLKNGFISEEEYIKAREKPIHLKVNPDPFLNIAPYFTMHVRGLLKKMIGNDEIYKAGLKVYTTLNVDIQMVVNEEVRKYLKEKNKKFVKNLNNTKFLSSNNIAKLLKVSSKKRLLKVLYKNKRYLIDLKQYPRYSKVSLSNLKRGGYIPVSARKDDDGKVSLIPEFGPQVALVVINSRGGEVLALTGGDDYRFHPFNRAINAKRQIGSLVKPFIFSCGLIKGLITPETKFQNKRIVLKAGKGKKWIPKNFSGGYDGKSYTLARIIEKSINVPTVRCVRKIGIDTVIDCLKSFGFSENIPRDLSISLGSFSESLLNITGIFTLFSKTDFIFRPYFIKAVMDFNGVKIYGANLKFIPFPYKKKILPVKKALFRVVSSGTGKKAKIKGISVFGKTGTSNLGRDLWFVGGCRNFIGGVWFGYDDFRPISKETGGSFAAPLWRNIFVNLCRKH